MVPKPENKSLQVQTSIPTSQLSPNLRKIEAATGAEMLPTVSYFSARATFTSVSSLTSRYKVLAVFQWLGKVRQFKVTVLLHYFGF